MYVDSMKSVPLGVEVVKNNVPKKGSERVFLIP